MFTGQLKVLKVVIFGTVADRETPCFMFLHRTFKFTPRRSHQNVLGYFSLKVYSLNLEQGNQVDK